MGDWFRGCDGEYLDLFDGRDAMFVVLPDGDTVEADYGDEAHATLCKHLVDNYDYNSVDGWCRGYVRLDKRQIEFYPFAGWNLNLADHLECTLARYTHNTGKGIQKLIRKYAKPGYRVWVEFENHTEDYIYEGDEA